MSKTDSKAAADMTEAVSLSGVSRRSVLSDTCCFSRFSLPSDGEDDGEAAGAIPGGV